MARQYAIGAIDGLAGQVRTRADDVFISPGDELPEGTTSFDLLYDYKPTPADIAAGATPGKTIRIALEDVSVDLSAAEIRQRIMAVRAARRESADWGYFVAISVD